MIAWLGTGLLGANYVRAMLERSEQVRVWNRTAAKAEALASEGATVCGTPAEAVEGAERVHLILSDDRAVDQVLEAAKAGLAPGTLIIDHTTTSIAGTGPRIALWTERGHPFVHAPVFMAPKNAREATGSIVTSGDEALYERVRPLLEPMTGQVLYMGPAPDRAAACKLIGNLMIMNLTAGIHDVLALGKAAGLDAQEATALFRKWNPGASFPARITRVIEAQYDKPSWGLGMARKDARLMQEAADEAGLSYLLLGGLTQAMDAILDEKKDEGAAELDWTVFCRDVR